MQCYFVLPCAGHVRLCLVPAPISLPRPSISPSGCRNIQIVSADKTGNTTPTHQHQQCSDAGPRLRRPSPAAQFSHAGMKIMVSLGPLKIFHRQRMEKRHKTCCMAFRLYETDCKMQFMRNKNDHQARSEFLP